MKDAHDTEKNAKIIEDAFMGCCSSWERHFIMQRQGGQLPDFNWLVVLGFYKNSAAFGWPCKLEKVPGYPANEFVVFDLTVQDNTFVTISDWTHIEARKFNFRSVAYQEEKFPSALSMHTAVRAFVSPQQTLTTLAAECGWFDFELPCLKKVAKKLGHNIDADEILFDGLFNLSKKVLKKSDESIMCGLSCRLAVSLRMRMTLWTSC